MIRFVWCLVLIKINEGANVMNCGKLDIYFEKIVGLRPPLSDHTPILYQSEEAADPFRPVTSECIAKCQSNIECKSFVLNYTSSTCYWLRKEIVGVEENKNLFDTDTAWFVKTCLKIEKKCYNSWVFERVPGAVLIGNDSKILPQLLTRTECQQQCLNETQFRCRSIKFRITYNDDYDENPDSDIRGMCTLSDTDRHLLPNSYRVSSYNDEYFENECADYGSRFKYQDGKNPYCAYEEYDNVILAHTDLMFERKTKDECQNLCDESKSFECRGFSTISEKKTCLLHSEDSKILGPSLLKNSLDSKYYEKARCLNINVSCSETFMTISYAPELNFRGRIYMQGYSEDPECFVLGEGKSSLVLKLRLQESHCGIRNASASFDRSLMFGTLIIQFNALIQTQGDRVINVGCIFGNETKVLVGTGITINSSFPNKGSTLLNTTSNGTVSPLVEMRVLDASTQREVSDTQIGQILELIIELKNPEGSYDIWASHLIAMTERGEESIFLIDDKGCPTDLNIFPELQKTTTENTTQLVGTFQAFRFASSAIVRFSVIVQFCPSECPPIKCGNHIQSYGRRRREIISHLIDTINGSRLVTTNKRTPEERSAVHNQMPLEYIMVVRDSALQSDRLILGEKNKILVAGYDYTTNEVCMDYSLVLGLIVTWIIVQIIFIVCCIGLVRRYKRYYQKECMRQSTEELRKNFGIGFSNLENRRVHWADNGEIM